MKFVLLIIFAFYFNTIGFTKNFGNCPVCVCLIQAKIYNSNGDELVEQSCFSHESYVYAGGFTFQYNSVSNDSVWIFYLNPGDTLKLNCESASEFYDGPDFGIHSLDVLSGELTSYHEYNYYGACGSAIEPEAGIESIFTDSATVVVQIPFGPLISEKITIRIKRTVQELKEQEELNVNNTTISQILGTSQILFSTSSEAEQILDIFSYSGKLMKSIKVVGKQKIDLEELPSGVYIIHGSIDGEQIVGRFIRQ